MADGENGRFVAMKEVENTHERFEKVDDNVRVNAFDSFGNLAKTLTNLGRLGTGVDDRATERNAATLFLREGGTLDALNLEGLFEESGKRSLRISAGENSNDFMAVALEDLLHGDRLSHVTATFALDREHYLHGIGEIRGSVVRKGNGKILEISSNTAAVIKTLVSPIRKGDKCSDRKTETNLIDGTL